MQPDTLIPWYPGHVLSSSDRETSASLISVYWDCWQILWVIFGLLCWNKVSRSFYNCIHCQNSKSKAMLHPWQYAEQYHRQTLEICAWWGVWGILNPCSINSHILAVGKPVRGLSMDHYKQNQALMPIVALFPDAIYLLEIINITLTTWMGSQSIVPRPAAFSIT